MNVIETPLKGLLLITPRAFGDARGFFLETYQAERYAEAGIEVAFVQDNHSRSSRGVLRGLHYQVAKPQGKLVMVTRGAVFDVAVDIRKDSQTFGRWHGVELSDANHMQLFVPPGFAHGFCVLSETADFHYKCTEYYAPETERTIIWNDPDIGINWPIATPSLSTKDSTAPRLRDVPPEDLF
ncbi:dTDP-4-dehydrorhamnose 3,5-epimerase [Desulfonatronum thiosulfatophilum]|uniref:dTDP-4-dehydrorhamnose 3,5-epimerase n=1 Tax=Desulfonatronum thiosulfatophilum TaxID=617002 RepID=A0A1G6EUU4_9BACT|nr:dTDP-4-dehydrorhamnose 3,5-epimerase [Desulfonatronum thiosulfatophilum]SDB61244.1 dTDP-4-dehydrorhamnose 3,5-epimerase [Desulfonatronum thiosulfatophilum]